MTTTSNIVSTPFMLSVYYLRRRIDNMSTTEEVKQFFRIRADTCKTKDDVDMLIQAIEEQKID